MTMTQKRLTLKRISRCGSCEERFYHYGGASLTLSCPTEGLADGGARTLSMTPLRGEPVCGQELAALLAALGFDGNRPIRRFTSARRPADGDAPTEIFCQRQAGLAGMSAAG